MAAKKNKRSRKKAGARASSGDKTPATGSFPGYQLGVDVVTEWLTALRSSSEALNGLWGKAKNKELKLEDYGYEIVKSLDAMMSFYMPRWERFVRNKEATMQLQKPGRKKVRKGRAVA